MDAEGELAPGEALAIRVAAVEHDVRVYGCPPDDVVTQPRPGSAGRRVR